MTVKEIRKYIDILNNKKGEESIFTRPISKSVDIAKVWSEKTENPDSTSYRFFL